MSTEPPTDRRGLTVLSASECDRHLTEETVGRVAYPDAGEVTIVPVLFAYVDGHIVFRSAVGGKLSASAMQQHLGFEIDGWDTETKRGWSVLVVGRADHVSDEAQTARYESLGLQDWVGHGSQHWIKITPHQITGRRLGDS